MSELIVSSEISLHAGYPLATLNFAASERKEEVSVNPDNLRFLLGLKLKTLRLRRGMTLAEVGQAAGVAVSYLSEIEKGRKYPKPDKIFALARALGASFDDLVSTRLGADLVPLTELLDSVLERDFPLHLFGLSVEDLFGIVTDHPRRAAALVRTIFDLARMYDVDLEDFLLAALRSWQQLHRNYFPDCEEAAGALRAEAGWADRRTPITPEELERLLVERWSYSVDDTTLANDPTMRSFRSVYVDGTRPRLYLNSGLLAGQRAFVLAREVGYRLLGLEERATTSSWIAAESFDQVLNNFLASYVASALLLPRERVLAELGAWLGADRADPEALAGLLESWGTTPETAFHRFTEVLPEGLDLRELAFLRLSQSAGSAAVRATKLLNLSSLPFARGFAAGEHRCRRWAAFGLFDRASARQGHDPRDTAAAVRRVEVIGSELPWLELAMARPLALGSGYSAVTILVGLDESARRVVGFWDHPDLATRVVNLTCERCPLSAAECAERVAPATIVAARGQREARAAAVRAFVELRRE